MSDTHPVANIKYPKSDIIGEREAQTIKHLDTALSHYSITMEKYVTFLSNDSFHMLPT